MRKGQGEGKVCKESPSEVEVVVNYFPYLFFPTKTVKGKLTGEKLVTQKGEYVLEIPSLKEKLTAVFPFVVMAVLTVFLTEVIPDSLTAIASASIGIVGGVLYGLFRPYGLLLLFLSLFFGYDYRFAIAYFILTFSVTAAVLFFLKGKRVKKGVYVVIPPRLFRHGKTPCSAC